ncbi:unnamed protein product [Sordaria macrospora k-hell]|uniref:WGS project CABT00000000 data, contig 2.26 n=1 Tax=Sordaria macrospora (strain ATCC MYA-333 / DSM 997 / K(L3346) / K-hell) TaxID=771870 RepID=F7W443_SORMK|nr:uncharacterized protein SMAC_05574 [Sordaria macrospora k-hell]CCC12397.1 unnamed protein product [Sordaria macrospora k-hell]
MLLQRLTVLSGIRSSLSSLSSLSFKASSASAFTRCSPYSTQPEATPKKVSDPLRILFCGSDVFSCYSLKALHAEHKANPGLIKSIDVMVRTGKAVGRGYKEIRQVPIQNLAEELSLPIHIRDTFTGWSLPQTAGSDGEPINLIVAVSFGLFVPPRILGQAKYGGLNVHPSLLPDEGLRWEFVDDCTLPVAQPKQTKGSSKAQEPAKIELELPLTYPHPLEESIKGSPKRIILEDVSEILPSETAEDAGLAAQYAGYQRLLQYLNSNSDTSSGTPSSGSTGVTGSTLQQVLNITSLPSTSSNRPNDASDPLFWLLRFGENNEYVNIDVETTVGGANAANAVNGEKATTAERKPRVSWGLCTRLGLGDNGKGKEEDKGAVTFMMKGEDYGRFGLLRVGKIKVEGKGSKPARQVVRELAVKAF